MVLHGDFFFFQAFLAAAFIFIFSMTYSKYPDTIKPIKAKGFLKPGSVLPCSGNT